ncbi:MAG: 50S ribosomal protein L28 [Candidatus Kerfeldbacteria bacterium]|nr:50S ribosomal protein L28 [Candidatus Kerfeldbacteria bacterium]
MSKVCDVCERGYLKGHSRSHSNIATIKRQHVNLQYAVIGGKRQKACTRCIRTSLKKAQEK